MELPKVAIFFMALHFYRLVQNPFKHFIHDPGSYSDQHNIASRATPFVPWVIRQSTQGTIVQAFAIVAVRQRPTTDQMNPRRWRCTAYEIAMIIVDSLTHRAEVTWWRTAAMVVLAATVIITMVIVLALLRAAVVVIVALIGARIQQRGGTEHQHTQAGNQTFRHFHQVNPHCTYSKKGFRT
jgi:hypothetical protein